ncbi:MAG: HlyC/CorC family transporter [Rhizobiales bacterium]|nr:HlyC/CorC family transporter [Hyphomicrobiales bacterium]
MSNSNNPPEQSNSFFKSLFRPLFDLISKAQGEKLRESLEDVIDSNDEILNAFSAEEKSMIRNILEFSDVNVESIKVPRADIIAADLKTNISDLFLIFSDGGYSRCPIYNGNLDKPVGMVHFKDMMNWLVSKSILPNHADGKQIYLEQVDFSQSINDLNIIRDVLYVPPSMMASDLLLTMQKQRIHMALVIDEYGGTDGLLTIEDLVEEIVGEIEDEHDEQDLPTIEEIDKNNYTADARLPMEALEEYLKVDFLSDDRDEDVDTLGGLVFSLAGRIPIRGELIKHASGTIFEILEADSRRIKRVKISLKTTQQDATNDQ